MNGIMRMRCVPSLSIVSGNEPQISASVRNGSSATTHSMINAADSNLLALYLDPVIRPMTEITPPIGPITEVAIAIEQNSADGEMSTGQCHLCHASLITTKAKGTVWLSDSSRTTTATGPSHSQWMREVGDVW